MATAVAPFLYPDGNFSIFGQDIDCSQRDCLWSPPTRKVNTAIVESDGNLLAPACAGRFVTASCMRGMEAKLRPL